MRVFRKVLAFFGWIDDSLMGSRTFDHSGACSGGLPAFVCGVVFLFAARRTYLAIRLRSAGPT